MKKSPCRLDEFRIEYLDVQRLPLSAKGLVLLACCCSSVWTAIVPEGTVVEIRLQQEINSYSSVAGTSFRGVVVSPVATEGRVLIPAGSIARGTIDRVRRVGLGLVRERASLGLRVSEIELPDGRRLSISSQMTELENAREGVDRNGRIRGIRSTDTPGYRATGLLVSIASVEPIAMLFSSAAFATVLRFSEPEIRLTPGAEFRIRLTSPVDAGEGFTAQLGPVTASSDERRVLFSTIPRLPYRARTPQGADSDFTNLVFIGSQDAISRAFSAAGWHAPETVSAAVRYRTLRAVAESQAYQQAPMSPLLLDGELPVLSRTKSLNSFARRHHLRVFATQETWNGSPVYTASATQDSAIGFSMKEKAFVHLIDPWIDRERSKVFDDLALTGCVSGSELVPRPWLPQDATNATGDRLISDGHILVVRLNACADPHSATEPMAPSPGPYRGNGVMRASRRFLLTARNDVVRGNVIYQGVAYTSAGIKLMRRNPGKSGGGGEDVSAIPSDSFGSLQEEMSRVQVLPYPPVADLGNVAALGWSSSFVSPRSAVGASRAAASARGQKGQASQEWAPPSMELTFQLGQGGFGPRTLGPEGLRITFRPPDGSTREVNISAANTVRPGCQIGGALTVNSHRWVSHEIGFQYMRGTFEPDLSSPEPATAASLKYNFKDQPAGLFTRQISYSTIFQLRPRESRWSPYLAAGPALSLMNLTDSPFQKAKGVFRLGLSNVGMMQAAYNFGSAAPLQGGGVFQGVFQYGGGFKIRVAPRWTYRIDFRTGVSRHPNFLSRSVERDPGVLEPGGPSRIESIDGVAKGFLHQRRISTGFAFTF